MSVCRDCGAEIDWMCTQEGRYIPVDPEPVFVIRGSAYGGPSAKSAAMRRFTEGEGDEHFYDEELGEITGRTARAEEVQTREAKINTPLGYVPHWRTCRMRRQGR